jgi:hypothetical protein
MISDHISNPSNHVASFLSYCKETSQSSSLAAWAIECLCEYFCQVGDCLMSFRMPSVELLKEIIAIRL